MNFLSFRTLILAVSFIFVGPFASDVYADELNIYDLTPEERQSIEFICGSAKLLHGPAAYNRCLRNQLAALGEPIREIPREKTPPKRVAPPPSAPSEKVPPTRIAPPPSGPSKVVPSRDIRLAQTLLSKLGYDPGPIDGVLGRRTRGAIQAFQRDIGVPITGVADDTLLAQLESATQLRKRLDKPRVRIARPSPKTYNSIRGTSKVLPRMPSRVTHQALDGTDLFRKVQSSIFVVIAGSSVRDFREGRELSQGSAVAVSTRHLLTNCHLLENRPYIVVIQGEKVVPAELVGRNECCDRCVLMVEKSFLTPVKGIRKFDDLVVGEKVYTVGAPIGLERTLGEGIISGLRKFEGEKLIQTSAPISSGSSGGGLFDTRGNLIGITTFLLDESQSLNFAIAAEQYWK